MMTDLLSGTDKETMIVRYTDFAEKASKQSSEREVLAVQIERKAEDTTRPSTPAAIWVSATRASSPA